MSKAARVLALLEALQDHGASTGPELAQRLRVDVRTVRRDVVALRELGIPVEGERGRGGSYRLKPGFRVPPLMFTSGEAAAAALGLLAARRLGLEAESALRKVRRVLPDPLRRGVESLEQILGFTGDVDAAPPDGETLLALADAAGRGRRVATTYVDSTGTETTRELSPHGVVAHQGRWYVAAFDHQRGQQRVLRADRIGTVTLLGAGAPKPPGFDATAFVSRQLARVPWAHEVIVHLDTSHEEAVRRFPPTLAELEPDDQGVTLRMRADSLDWAAGLLAGAGCSFTIVAPDELRAAVRRLAERLLEA
ncbi:YafY family transcriptional regulator [Solirubrobacter sp. CPCC 204708]|uniref:YafY family transcriptional regulator n=1 Tax=Solirubrobacter deserti TaxID=2282478 RepID=A0ABT4RQY1_9ACTN|nr:YafY family protein [Solirubrobacter deserti]MBE2320082.1 YafY family transcriptional regulator [Solirubrobacter deserti]MDA0140979.1 YafY family transcriptional regulator [Solirubrobacter deserti]